MENKKKEGKDFKNNFGIVGEKKKNVCVYFSHFSPFMVNLKVMYYVLQSTHCILAKTIDCETNQVMQFFDEITSRGPFTNH